MGLGKINFLLIRCLLWLHFIFGMGSKDGRKRDDEKCIFFSLGKLWRKASFTTEFLSHFMCGKLCCITSWSLYDQMHLCWCKTLIRTIMQGTNPWYFALLYWYDSWGRLVYTANSYRISYLHCSLHSHSMVYKSWRWQPSRCFGWLVVLFCFLFCFDLCVCVCSVLAFYWSVIHMQKSEHITGRQFETE